MRHYELQPIGMSLHGPFHGAGYGDIVVGAARRCRQVDASKGLIQSLLANMTGFACLAFV
jgi:hypothetical protein